VRDRAGQRVTHLADALFETEAAVHGLAQRLRGDAGDRIRRGGRFGCRFIAEFGDGAQLVVEIDIELTFDTALRIVDLFARDAVAELAIAGDQG
jgi:hypothetical protein